MPSFSLYAQNLLQPRIRCESQVLVQYCHIALLSLCSSVFYCMYSTCFFSLYLFIPRHNEIDLVLLEYFMEFQAAQRICRHTLECLTYVYHTPDSHSLSHCSQNKYRTARGSEEQYTQAKHPCPFQSFMQTNCFN